MSDIMRPMPFAHLMNWILGEYRTTQSIFGVSKLTRRGDGKALPIFDEKIETAFGPAASIIFFLIRISSPKRGIT